MFGIRNIANSIADGFSNGNEQFAQASYEQQMRYIGAAQAVLLDIAEAEGLAMSLLRKYHAAMKERNECGECCNECPWEECERCSDAIGPIIAEQNNLVISDDWRQFGASEAAGYLYPGEDQEAERQAYRVGASIRSIIHESIFRAPAIREVKP